MVMKKMLVAVMIVVVGMLSMTQEARAEKPLVLMMKVEGTRYILRDGVMIGSKNLYVITLGDTAWQDAKAEARGRAMQGKLGPFASNAAQYAENGDGSWRMWSFRPPKFDARLEEMNEWIEYLGREDVSEFLENFDRNTPQDFGKPGDFIYARGHIAVSELPEPFNRASAETLKAVLSLFRYNEDGTMRMELRDPYWEEDRAQVIFDALSAEMERK
jgi:hypothetical protein